MVVTIRAPILLTAILLGGCAAERPVFEPPAPGPTFVRLHNASASTLEDVQVSFRGTPVSYGTVGPGETSGYRPEDGAYRYAYMRATVNGEAYVLQPIDYVGERRLGGDYCTYHVVVSRAWPQLMIERVSQDPGRPLAPWPERPK